MALIDYIDGDRTMFGRPLHGGVRRPDRRFLGWLTVTAIALSQSVVAPVNVDIALSMR